MDQSRGAVPQDGDHDDGHDSSGGPLVAKAPLTASERLRAAREAKGLTIADIAARTRITVRHVEALDRGDLAALPGRPYVLGFVRNYARVVGLDEAELATLARGEMDAGVPRPAPRVVHQFDVDDPSKTPSRLLTWLALALCVGVLAVGGVFWRSYYAPGTDLPSLAQPDPSPTQAAPPARPVAAAPAPNASGPVVFTAREDKIWVKFYNGQGVQLLQKQLALGESYTVPADAVEPKLWTGRPDALTITVGGQAVPPLSDHRTIMRDVPVTAQALIARGQPAPAAQPGAQTPAPAPAVSLHPMHRVRHHAVTAGAADAAADAPAPVAPAPSASAVQ